MFDVLLERWRSMLIGSVVPFDREEPSRQKRTAKLSEAAAVLADSIDWGLESRLWPDLPKFANAGDLRDNYARLLEMAIALETEGSALYRDEALSWTILRGLEWMYAERYNERTAVYGNWWHWEIGAPLSLLPVLCIMRDRLSEKRLLDYLRPVDRFIPEPTTMRNSDRPESRLSTGANRAWKCHAYLLRSLLKREAAGIEAACAALTPVFEYVTEGDGFYEDGSFIQHKRFAYTGGYGKSLLKEVADMAFLLHGTAWALPSGQIHTALDWVERSFAPFMFEGRLMDLVRGREISRFFLDDERAGRQVVAAALRLSEVAPTDRADDLKRMTKSWIAGEAGRRFVDEAPMDIAAMAAKLLRDERTDPRGLAPSLRIFPMMDRAVARWPGYAISISMFSRRTGSYESINEENVRGWYTAHGMTYVYDDDADRYADGFWPTVNAYRLPGTTVSAQPRSEGFGLSRASAGDFVGGAASGDGFGAVGMELEETGEFRAKKSWFFFDDKVVALGTVWPDAEQIRVETIMDNRMLNAIGDNRLTVETEGRAASFVDVGVPVVLETRWIHLAGNVPGADIGYAFPQPATLRILREERSGSWREIDAKGPDEALRRHYITTWFEHDAYPARSEYAYVLLPGRTVEQTADYAASPSVEIMSHSPEVHAIAEPAKGRFAAHFWENARRAVGPIFCDGRATILLQEDDDRVDLWVADPTQANSGRITIELSIPVREVMVRNDRIVVDRLHPTVSLSVRTEGAGGGTLHIAFRK